MTVPVMALTPVDRSVRSVELPLGDGQALVTQGYGGWEEIERPRRTALTHWAGARPLRVEEPCLLDGMQKGRAVNDTVARLERIARRPPGERTPPVVKVDAGGLVPYDQRWDETKLWVVDNLNWGERRFLRGGPEVRIDPATGGTGSVGGDARLMRAEVTVTLLEYVEADRLRRIRPRVHVVRKGETLLTISKLYYGKTTRWREIARLNKIRDPRKLKVGKAIKLP
jgi:nucleoid-associated protein YgaU